MNKGIGIALLAVGIALIVFGIDASDSFSSSVSRAVSGTPTHKTMWLLISGIGSVVLGGIMMLRPAGRT